MSIAVGASRRHVYARPYFRGRAVCPRADIEIGSLLASQTPGSARDAAINRAIRRLGRKPDKLCVNWVSPYVDLKRVG